MCGSIRPTHNYTQAGLGDVRALCDTPNMKNLKRIRTARGMSQSDLAHAAGIKQATISRIENGVNNPSMAVAEEIAKALNVSVVELFGLPELELRFLEAFRAASDQRRAALLTILENDQ